MTDQQTATDTTIDADAHREVRERTATLEAKTDALRDDISEVADSQEEILATVRDLDSGVMTEDQFEEEYAEEIESNSRVRYLLKIGGALLTAVSSGTLVALI